jgi:signal transduction histidine kinase
MKWGRFHRHFVSPHLFAHPNPGQREIMQESTVRILLVEDDEDDYLIFKDLLSKIQVRPPDLAWIQDGEAAVDEMAQNRHDVYVVDYRLAGMSGLDVVEVAKERGCRRPIIVLTGYGDYETDVNAMKAGAVDYLTKGQIDAVSVERSIRYAMERARAAETVRMLAAQLVSSQEEERKVIAQELHDSIGGRLAAIKYGVEKAMSAGREGRKESGMGLEDVLSMIQGTIEEARRITARLRPVGLDDLGLIPAVHGLCREYQKLYTDVRIEARMDIKEKQVPQPLKIVIHRVLQEALTNALKHSGAENIRIGLKGEGNRVTLSVEDNGRGFDPGAVAQAETKGMGLESMKERTEFSGGWFSVLSDKDAGTHVRASWDVM